VAFERDFSEYKKQDIDCQNTYTGNCRFRVDENYERQYHDALQQGLGFNLPEVL